MDLIGVIGLVVALAATAVAIFFGYHEYRTGQRKKLGWAIVTEAPLFSLRKEARGKIEVLYNGQAIHDAHLVQVLIKNQGRRDIVPGDFIESAEPLKIGFTGSGKVLEILEIDKSSPSLEIAPLETLSNTLQLTIDKFFLQKGEWFSLRLMVSSYQGIKILARIADCDLIELEQGTSLRTLRRFLPPSYILVTGTIFGVLAVAEARGQEAITMPLSVVGFILFSMFVSLGFMVEVILYILRRIKYLSSPG